MSLVATLQQNHQERTAEAAQQYRELLERAKTLDEYRALLGRDSSEDAEQMTALMTTLKLSVDDVTGDFHALQAHWAATAHILDDEQKRQVIATLDSVQSEIGDEAGTALIAVWNAVPVPQRTMAFKELFNAVWRFIPESDRLHVGATSRHAEWFRRRQLAVHQHDKAIAADRQARVEVARLEQSNPRVLGKIS